MAKKSSKKIIWLLAFSPLLALLLGLTLAGLGVFGTLPNFDQLENPSYSRATIIYSADGKVLGKYYIQNRTTVDYDEISPKLIDALVSTEDARYFNHSGIDARALARAIGKLGKDGGGSTITQQLAKILFHGQDQNNAKFDRGLQKLKEWVIAAKLERTYTKQEIITMYLNAADFGHEVFGIQTASKVFFNKSPKELDYHEAATLVGMLKAPSYYSPIRNEKSKKRCLSRRNTVLEQMVKYGKIDNETAEKYKKMELSNDEGKMYERIQRNQYGMGEQAAYFLSELKKDLSAWCKNNINKETGKPYDIYRDGLRVYTTIDSKMQQYAEDAAKEWMSNLQNEFFKSKKKSKNGPWPNNLKAEEVEKKVRADMKNSDRWRSHKAAGLSDAEIEATFREPVEMKVFSWKGYRDTVMTPWDSLIYYKFFLQCGMMSMETHTGYVRAWVGGIDYKSFKFDHVRAAQRQVGSTFKPFVYSMAMQEHLSPCTQVPNIKVCIDNWCPDNSGSYKEGQMITLQEGLAQSINYISAYLMKQYGPHAVLKFVEKLGIDVSDIEAVPAICLGTPDISVYEMVGAFNTFSNKGIFIKPQFLYRIEDKNGNLLQEFYPERNEALDEVAAWLTIQLMKGVTQGTGGRLRSRYKFNWPVAGKTGTTQNNSDGWFIGTTPDITTGVWVGGEDRQIRFSSTAQGQGANMALPIWALYMLKVYNDPVLNYSKGDFERPSKEIHVQTDCGEYNQELRESYNDYPDFDN